MNSVTEQEASRQVAAVRAAARLPVAPACVSLYLAVVVGLLLAILHRDHDVFTYTLDDPYIHLALAENLSHGHYGINPGEASSPSSSIVWPLLLAPFARMQWSEFLPLGLNVLFCGMAAWLIGRVVDGWDGWAGTASADAGGIAWLGRFAAAVALMLTANLAGLTFVGMEHGLQVLVAVVCAAGMAEAFAGRPIPKWCLWAAALGPMVRYEDFALVAAIVVVLYRDGKTGQAVRLLGASVVGPLLFGLFLHSRGLPMLPSSVMVKENVYSYHGGIFETPFITMLQSVYLGVQQPAWWSLVLVAVLLRVLMLREKPGPSRSVLAGALVVAVLQLTFGHFNWFHRYEVYAIAFTALVAATALVESTRVWRGAVVAGLLALGASYALALWQTPTAAANVYEQQYQMHRFVADYYRKSVAVNDLGWVSYRRPAGVYVLDLWGLASPEVSREGNKDSDWLDAITQSHHTGLAMIYPQWFHDGVPDDWTPLATMCVTSLRPSAGMPCMVFYSTGVGNTAELTTEMAAFARTLPASVKITLGSDTSDQ